MFIDRLNTAFYALTKSLSGYELLKNPKDASPNELNMIKSTYYINDMYGDDVFVYSRLHREKNGNKFVETEKELQVTHLMDPDTKEVTNKKNIEYYVVKDNQYVYGSEKYAISRGDMCERRLPDWDIKQQNKIILKRLQQQNQRAYYQPRITLLEQILTLVNAKNYRTMAGIVPDKPIKSGFIKVLLNNLKLSK